VGSAARLRPSWSVSATSMLKWHQEERQPFYITYCTKGGMADQSSTQRYDRLYSRSQASTQLFRHCILPSYLSYYVAILLLCFVSGYSRAQQAWHICRLPRVHFPSKLHLSVLPSVLSTAFDQSNWSCRHSLDPTLDTRRLSLLILLK
jgi:hypothetical protein